MLIRANDTDQEAMPLFWIDWHDLDERSPPASGDRGCRAIRTDRIV